MKGIQRHDLQIVFASYSRQSSSEPVAELLINAGYHLKRNFKTAYLQNNLAGNKVLVVDVDLETCNSASLLKFLHRKSPEIPCLFVFHCGKKELDSSLLEHCRDFVIWPCDSEELLFRLHALVSGQLEKEQQLANYRQGNEMIGQSASFQNVLKRIRTFSACDAPVLIEGETGTGKEMIARAVHYYSDRKEHPFIPVNCGALPDNLIENELFGHVKGAYTDAKTQSTGLVGQANGGTLFLDEIESLTPKSQVALMRFLQEKEYKPLGSNVPLKSDIRIVTASNVAIDKLVAQGLMRQDLFFRLNILSVQLPPLKDRGDDIELLANHFLVKFQEQYELPVRRYHQKTLDWFKAYHWPGNIRELENLVLRAVLVCDDEFIRPRHFCDDNIYIQNQIQHAENQFVSDEFGDAELSVDESFSEAKSRVINSFEKCYLKKLMQKYAGNVTLAAKFACKERRALGKLLKKHGISRQNYLS